MSIRPEFAEAIMDGTKQVEFRKRALAHDVALVVVYATLPVGRILGTFTVAGQVKKSPNTLWKSYRAVAGIDRSGYRDYFANTTEAVGILVGEVHVLDEPMRLDEIDPQLRAPQSFQYLHGTQNERFRAVVRADREARRVRRRRHRRRAEAMQRVAPARAPRAQTLRD